MISRIKSKRINEYVLLQTIGCIRVTWHSQIIYESILIELLYMKTMKTKENMLLIRHDLVQT